MKNILKVIPETSFIGLSLYWALDDFLTDSNINYVAILAAWLLFLQLIYKNRVAGIFYGAAICSMSLFMVINVIGEFSGIATAQSMLLVNFYGIMFTLTTIMSGFMLVKYVKAQSNYKESVFTVTY